MTFRAQGKKKTRTLALARLLGTEGVPKGETFTWNGRPVKIPPLPPSGLKCCSIIDIEYWLAVRTFYLKKKREDAILRELKSNVSHAAEGGSQRAAHEPPPGAQVDRRHHPVQGTVPAPGRPGAATAASWRRGIRPTCAAAATASWGTPDRTRRPTSSTRPGRAVSGATLGGGSVPPSSSLRDSGASPPRRPSPRRRRRRRRSQKSIQICVSSTISTFILFGHSELSIYKDKSQYNDVSVLTEIPDKTVALLQRVYVTMHTLQLHPPTRRLCPTTLATI